MKFQKIKIINCQKSKPMKTKLSHRVFSPLRNPRLELIFTFLLLCPSFWAAGQTERVDTMEVRVGGAARHALVHIPNDDGAQKKVMFVFHGAGMNMYRMQDQLSAELSNYPDYIFVFGQALNTEVPVNCLTQPYMTQAWQVVAPYVSIKCNLDNDVLYAKELRDTVAAEYNIYQDSVFAFGYSSGGFFTFNLMKVAPNYFNKFAVFGAVSNYFVDHNSYDCNETLAELIKSENKLEGFDTLSLPNLQKPRPKARRAVYYIISQDDTTIDDIVSTDFRHPLFDFTTSNDSWFKIAFLEALFRNTPKSLTTAFRNYETFMSNLATIGASASWEADYGPSNQVKIEVFTTSGTNGHFMSNYPAGGIGGMLAKIVDFFE